jgi:hypothetical protein
MASQINQLGGNGGQPTKARHPKHANRDGPRCPTCDTRCKAEQFVELIRYRCPNKECIADFSVDVHRPIAEIREARRTIDDPQGFPVGLLGRWFGGKEYPDGPRGPQPLGATGNLPAAHEGPETTKQTPKKLASLSVPREVQLERYRHMVDAPPTAWNFGGVVASALSLFRHG